MTETLPEILVKNTSSKSNENYLEYIFEKIKNLEEQVKDLTFELKREINERNRISIR